ncbi:MAG: pyridoxal phosphate-dependent aminotransferase family protein [Bacteroidota bacterium]|nr:pyridoxal phosphate-dependent aminotransferase family protein [Bacteroidota bacterium]
MGTDPSNIRNALKQRQENNLLRTLSKHFSGTDFISNDYLGFSKLGLLAKNSSNASGSGGSRLISGNSDFIEETEKKIATFHKAESALVFNSGYDANVGIFSCVPQKNDVVLMDELIHASIYDGVRLSYAKHYKFKHNDMVDLKDLLHRHHKSFDNVFVSVESVYSMDGDEAPLKELIKLKEQYKNVFLIVDEAHAIGVFGKGLSGGMEDKFFARIYTYGKAMGCHGAAIVGSNELRNYLINFARSFIYTTALPDHAIANISIAYDLLKENKQQLLLRENIDHFLEKVKDIPSFIKSRSAIQCMVLNSNENATAIEDKLKKKNILSKAVKSPTVKEGRERIRFCLHAYNTIKEIDTLVKILKG